jgi:DNA-3-methyladenine glycosylase II
MYDGSVVVVAAGRVVVLLRVRSGAASLLPPQLAAVMRNTMTAQVASHTRGVRATVARLSAEAAEYGAGVPGSSIDVASAALARQAPRFAPLVAAIPCDLGRGRRSRSHFEYLARAICYQQLAGAAARAIHARFEGLFDGAPTAEAVLLLPDDLMRGVGLSSAKVASIRDLAVRVVAGDVRLARIGRYADDEIVRQLVEVRGIGRWTAEMFLMFQLGRLDVWPVDDFGVRKGYGRLYGLPEMPTARVLEPLGDAFRPFRSVAAWYCWRAADTVLPAPAKATMTPKPKRTR